MEHVHHLVKVQQIYNSLFLKESFLRPLNDSADTGHQTQLATAIDRHRSSRTPMSRLGFCCLCVTILVASCGRWPVVFVRMSPNILELRKKSLGKLGYIQVCPKSVCKFFRAEKKFSGTEIFFGKKFFPLN